MRVVLSQLAVYKRRRQQLRDVGVKPYVLHGDGLERVCYGATDLAWQVMLNEFGRSIAAQRRKRGNV